MKFQSCKLGLKVTNMEVFDPKRFNSIFMLSDKLLRIAVYTNWHAIEIVRIPIRGRLGLKENTF